ncbi:MULTISPECIES: hypothetical protein [unclassified Paenibacillus]|uniref:hypothetical protein n=1 Tax=unclassified Paenibacillus TaxID=185978 RepID=UPI001B4BB8B0|nr:MULTISPECIES: hypothetical protein [unclassified Paenibacillus]MBP1153268.1 hypothetical protein [Paenibacillus sp. PvP091]MBP1171349.1 hypothetical protein [Paenibacillus sp. PvR098]MBP2442377.1 hypothetical protein [Paenibacillus sp. PvP052]
MRYFIDWVAERCGEILIQDVTAAMLREYMLLVRRRERILTGVTRIKRSTIRSAAVYRRPP